MEPASPKPMIEAQGLTKYYGPFVAIENISFSIPEGQIVAFLGPNGAGKTTTMKMLTGYLAPSAGAARIAGLDVHKERIEASKKLGYLPENGPLYPDMTPNEALEFFGEAREMSPQQLKDRLDFVRSFCALHQVMEKPIGKLSRGLKQRVGFGRTFSLAQVRTGSGRSRSSASRVSRRTGSRSRRRSFSATTATCRLASRRPTTCCSRSGSSLSPGSR